MYGAFGCVALRPQSGVHGWPVQLVGWSNQSRSFFLLRVIHVQLDRRRDRHRQLTCLSAPAFATALAAFATVLLGMGVAVLRFAFAILPIRGNTRVACVRDSFSTGISGSELSGMLIRSSGRGRKKRVGQVAESQHQVMCFVRGRQMARHVRLSAVRSRFVDGTAVALRSILMLAVLFVPSIRILSVKPIVSLLSGACLLSLLFGHHVPASSERENPSLSPAGRFRSLFRCLFLVNSVIVSASPGFIPAVLRRDRGTHLSVLGRRLVNFFFITMLGVCGPSGFHPTFSANVAISRMAVIAGAMSRVSKNGACMRARTRTGEDSFTFTFSVTFTFTCRFPFMLAQECSCCFHCVLRDRFFHIFSLEFVSWCPVMCSGALADDISRGFMCTFPHRFSGVFSSPSTHAVWAVVSIEAFAGVFAKILSSWHVGCSTSRVRRGRGTRRATLAFSFAFDMLSVRRSILMLGSDAEKITVLFQSHTQFVSIRGVRAHSLPIFLRRLDHPKLVPCRSLWNDGTQSSPDDGTDFVVIVFRDVLYSQHDRIRDIIIIIRQILGGDVHILLAPGNTNGWRIADC